MHEKVLTFFLGYTCYLKETRVWMKLETNNSYTKLKYVFISSRYFMTF